MIVDVSQWTVGAGEPRGKRDKVWIADEEGHMWLRKTPASARPYEHVIEWLAFQIAQLMRVSCAEARLCVWNNGTSLIQGIVCRNFVGEHEDLHSGDALLSYDRNYDVSQHPLHSVDRVFTALFDWRSEGWTWVGDRADFLRMLAFDVIVGNCDRHQANWSVISPRRSPDKFFRLSPMYDPASCLGAELQDSHILLANLKANDFSSRVRRYVDRASSGFGNGTRMLSLRELADDLFRFPEWDSILRESLTVLRETFGLIQNTLESVPIYWYPAPRRRLALAILSARAQMVEECLYGHRPSTCALV